MSAALFGTCALCGLDHVSLKPVQYRAYALRASPEHVIAFGVCRECRRRWTGRGGTFYGGAAKANSMRKRLERLTQRPWEWSLALPPTRSGKFYVSEGTVTPFWTPSVEHKPRRRGQSR